MGKDSLQPSGVFYMLSGVMLKIDGVIDIAYCHICLIIPDNGLIKQGGVALIPYY
jgi:hypothetical protein